MRQIRWPRDGVGLDVWLPGREDRPAAPRREASRMKRIDVGLAPRDSPVKAAKERRSGPEQLTLFDEPPDR